MPCHPEIDGFRYWDLYPSIPVWSLRDPVSVPSGRQQSAKFGC